MNNVARSSGTNELEPLTQGVAEGGREVVDVPKDDVVLEREWIQVTVNTLQLPLTVEYRLSKNEMFFFIVAKFLTGLWLSFISFSLQGHFHPSPEK